MKNLKKKLSMLLALTAVVSTAGCGGSSKSTGGTQAEVVPDNFFKTNEKISYVMIYNPDIYDEYSDGNKKLSTGDFKEYIDVDIDRADELLEPVSTVELSSFAQNAGDIPFGNTELPLSKSGMLSIPYVVGDVREFYGEDKWMQFECKYVGANCNVWVYDNQVTASDAEIYGKEFDEKMFNEMTKLFGTARYIEDGEKLNILLYPLSGNIAGFFMPAELFTKEEQMYLGLSTHNRNAGEAIIHVNSKLGKESMYATIAHEYQHMINMTDALYTKRLDMMSTWFNESMSGYIEEYLYQGIKEKDGYYKAFNRSDIIRNGQSLYNFDITDRDIGPYGSVYLFSEYLEELGGGDVFTKVHSYWRSAGIPTTAGAIMESISEDSFKMIDESIEYSDDFKFNNDEEEWMSKMTLDFYVNMFTYDGGNPKEYENIKKNSLLYNEINSADIEGGGRVIIALKDGEFEAPEDADTGLVYVGFDEDFKKVTDYICQ